MIDKKVKIRSMVILSVVLLLLSTIKAIAGIISNSSAVESDAIQSGTDLIIAITSLIALIFATRPPDKNFRYGYYKIENLVTFLISLGIFATVIGLIISGVRRIIEPVTINYPFWAMGSTVLSIIVSLALGIYLMRIAKESKSPTIIANAKDKLSDSVVSLAVLISLITSFFNVKYVEGIVTILVSLLVGRVGIEIGKDSILSLLDVIDRAMYNEISKVIKNTKGVEGFSKLRIRKMGSYYSGDCEIEINKSLEVEEAHDILENVIRNVKETIPQVVSFIVEIEPKQKKVEKVIIPINEYTDETTKIHPDFNDAKNFVMMSLDIENKDCKREKIYSNPFYLKTAEGIFKLAKFVEKHKIDTLIVQKIGEVGFNQLTAERVDIYRTEKNLMSDIVKAYLENDLEKLTKPTDENSI